MNADPVLASVVIPAHNEAAVIGTLLGGLADGRFEVIVVCNGCEDDTAGVAARYPGVRVIEIPEPSKRLAIERGDELAREYPRLFVDADVALSADSAAHLVAALTAGVHAVAPVRRLPMDGVAAIVRWYYDVWQALPQVRSGLFGRGVIGLTEEGNRRVRGLPSLMGDDLVASDAFEPSERAIVAEAEVVVWPPRTVGDLLRRRTRAVIGNAEADREGVRRASSATSIGTLVTIARERRDLIPKLPIFIAVAIVSRLRARRAIRAKDTATWHRDDSSRDRVDPEPDQLAGG